MKAWLIGGPFDGAAIEVPAIVERMEFQTDTNTSRIVYQHDGQPGDLDQIAPEMGVRLYFLADVPMPVELKP